MRSRTAHRLHSAARQGPKQVATAAQEMCVHQHFLLLQTRCADGNTASYQLRLIGNLWHTPAGMQILLLSSLQSLCHHD